MYPGHDRSLRMAEPTHQAVPEPQAGGLYPYLAARTWSSAGHLAALAAKYRGMCVEAWDRARKVLTDAHSMFRDLKSPEAPQPLLRGVLHGIRSV
jgi:hypothetical protein